jgi:ribosomal protein S18 acetylase RimI-like enzyme
MERYRLTQDGTEYALVLHELERWDGTMIAELGALDLLTYSEPTFSRYTLGGFLRHGRVFTVTADDILVGACHCLRDFADPDEVVIFNMALRPGWRGHGLGTRFLAGILERLAARGTRSVRLLVNAANARAIAVYQAKFGFELVAHLDDPYSAGQPYLEMRLDMAAHTDRAVTVSAVDHAAS